MTNKTPVIVTVVLLIIGFVLVTRKDNTPQTDSPDNVVWSMFDAAKQGNVRKYLACFTPGMASQVTEAMKEMSRPAFSRYLQRRSEEVMGIALSDRQIEGDSATMKVELVYRDKNEVQYFTVARSRGFSGPQWKIQMVTDAERIKTIVPYGTEVVPLAPPPRSRKAQTPKPAPPSTNSTSAGGD